MNTFESRYLHPDVTGMHTSETGMGVDTMVHSVLADLRAAHDITNEQAVDYAVALVEGVMARVESSAYTATLEQLLDAVQTARKEDSSNSKEAYYQVIIAIGKIKARHAHERGAQDAIEAYDSGVRKEVADLGISHPLFERHKKADPEAYYTVLSDLYQLVTTFEPETIRANIQSGTIARGNIEQLVLASDSDPKRFPLHPEERATLLALVGESSLPGDDVDDEFLKDPDVIDFINGVSANTELPNSGTDDITRAA